MLKHSLQSPCAGWRYLCSDGMVGSELPTASLLPHEQDVALNGRQQELTRSQAITVTHYSFQHTPTHPSPQQIIKEKGCKGTGSGAL